MGDAGGVPAWTSMTAEQAQRPARLRSPLADPPTSGTGLGRRDTAPGRPAWTNTTTQIAGSSRSLPVSRAAAITTEAATELQLRTGSPIRILIKSTEVSVASDPVGRVSIGNLLAGKIVAVDHGEVMSTVKIDIGSDQVLTAAITKDSAEELDLQAGAPVTALIKATNVAVSVE